MANSPIIYGPSGSQFIGQPQGVANSVLMNDGSGNLNWQMAIAAQATLSTTTSVTAGNPIPYDTISFDTTSSYNTGTFTYVVPKTGFYLINIITQSNGASNPSIYLNYNGSNIQLYFCSLATGEIAIKTGVVQVQANSGDALQIVPDTTFSASAITNRLMVYYLG